MKQHIAIAIALGALGAARTAAAAPSWCKDAAFDGDVDLKDLTDKDPEKVIITFAHAACAPTPEVETHKAEIEQNRAAWGKRLGMVESDWGDVVAYVNANEGRNTRLNLSTKDATKFTPIDQFIAITEGFPRPDGYGPYKEPIYVTDMCDAQLSEVGRYGYIKECLRSDSASVTSNAPPAAEWAVCQGDMEKFDLAKFQSELRADTGHTGDVKMVLRFQTFSLKSALKEHAAAVEKAKGVDPVYAKMFEIASKTRGEWAAGLGTNSELIGLALKVEAASFAGSRRLFEGCEETTAAALATAVAKVPASTWKGMKDVRFDPFGGFTASAGPVLATIPEVSLAAIPYVLCRPTTGTSGFLLNAIGATPGFRGPRTTVLSRLLLEKFQLDDVNERLLWPDSDRNWSRSGGSNMSSGGVVAKVTIEGDIATVQLERLLVKTEECTQRHSTNRLARIRADGTLEYEQICDKTEMVTHDEQWADFKINKAYAPLLKKGVKFSAVNSDDPKRGMDVVAIWPNKSAVTPSWLLGAAVK
ncbi:MAG: hypothetical protein K8W52_23090 [Deltaproteobacteria bacterium]|nr:hypothetical protein [Deltaproteobacteria bacterium]